MSDMRMRNRGLGGLAAAAAALIWLGGCSAQQSQQAPSQMPPGQSVASPTAGAAGGFPLPTPGQIQHYLHALKSPSFVDTRDASDFVPGFSQHVATIEPDAIFSPDWADNHSRFDTIAYAIYSFEPSGWSGQLTLHTDWPQPPGDYSKLWLGLSDWEKDRWDWYNGAPSGDPELAADGLDRYRDAGTRETYIAVVLLGQTSGLLRKVWFDGMSRRGDWWMYGHDAQHSSCSRFVGPVSPTVRQQFRIGRKYKATVGNYSWYHAWSSAAYNIDNISYHIIYYIDYEGWGGGFPVLIAFNPNGSMRWRYAMPVASDGVFSSPAVDNDGAIIATPKAVVYAFSESGELAWQSQCHHMVSFMSAIGPEGNIYTIGFGDGAATETYLHALAKNGTQLWEYYFGAGPENPLPCRGSATAPAVAPDGTVYVGCWDNKLYAFTSGGTLKWTCTAGGAVKTDPSIAKDGTVYFATDEPKLYAVDAAGAVVWAIPLAGAAQGMASIAKDGTLRLPCADGRLYALNAGGTPRWSYITGLSHSSPTLDASGTTYIGSEDGKLYAIRADGSLKWTFSASDEIWAQPTISEDGSLHFLDVASLFYCLGPGAG